MRKTQDSYLGTSIESSWENLNCGSAIVYFIYNIWFISRITILLRMNVIHTEKNPKFSFRTPERPTSLFYSYKQDTHTDIALYIFRFMYRYTVLLYTTCKDELYFCEHNSYTPDTHKHTDTLYTTCIAFCLY